MPTFYIELTEWLNVQFSPLDFGIEIILLVSEVERTIACVFISWDQACVHCMQRR